MCFPHTIPRNAAPLPCQPASLAATPPSYPKETQAATGSEAMCKAWRSDSEAANLWNSKAACLPALPCCIDQPGQSQPQLNPCRSKDTKNPSQVSFRGKSKILPGSTELLDPHPSCFTPALPYTCSLFPHDFKELPVCVACFLYGFFICFFQVWAQKNRV